MAKGRSTEAKLARLRELRGAPFTPQLLEELRGALRDGANLVAAKAAELIGAAQWSDLVPDLAQAFERFLDHPEKKDKLCRAKIAVVEALNKLEFADEDFYTRGIHYVQHEPVWGGTIDTAVPVRVASAFGLVRLRQRGVLTLLVDMLADPEKGARTGAVQALANTGTEAAGLLLRLKARLGDKEPEVISECFGGILELTRDEGTAFVAEFLDSPAEAIQEGALLALGSSRLHSAHAILKTFAEKRSGELQEIAFMALALLRLPLATDYLLTIVSEQTQVVATAALKALAIQGHDPRVRERAAAAIAKNGAAALQPLFDQRFHTSE